MRVRVQLQTLENVVTVPEKAVSEGAEGPQIFVVDDQSRARARPVRLGPVVEGRQVILEGLKANETLIVGGLVDLRDGTEVETGDDDEEAE